MYVERLCLSFLGEILSYLIVAVFYLFHFAIREHCHVMLRHVVLFLQKSDGAIAANLGFWDVGVDLLEEGFKLLLFVI